jgi:POT family proton-dependent oligopeptide transporter
MTSTTAGGASFFGHPRGLATLFFTEFFERFSFYGLRALLILFLTAAVERGGLGIDTESAGAIYGVYAGAVYLCGLPGGWIADRLLGQRESVFYGGLLISAGNFMLAVPVTLSFYLGLIVVAFGTGLLKPNISTMVGGLYRGQPGTRRDAGFSIFYMGINLGGMFAPIVAGGIGEILGYRFGFATAGAAMLFGSIQYRLTAHRLGDAGLLPAASNTDERRRSLRWLAAGLALAIAGITAVASGLVTVSAQQLSGVLGQFMGVLAFVFFGGVLLFGRLDATDRKRVGVIVVFFCCSSLFWAGFEQAATTFNLFARDDTDRSLFGSFFTAGEHPASWYQAINSTFIILLSPFFAWLWIALGRRNLDPSAPVKFGLGLAQLGLGFGTLAIAATWIVAHGGKVGPQWLLLTYLLHTTGELCLSPIGLSNVTKLAPARFSSQMMGMWFLGMAVGNLVAGRIGGHLGGDIALMPSGFLRITLICVGGGALMFVLSPLLKRWMGDIR